MYMRLYLQFSITKWYQKKRRALNVRFATDADFALYHKEPE